MDTVETCVVVCGIGKRSSHERTPFMMIRNKGLEPSYRYLGELETDRVGGGAEVGCVTSGPRTSRAPRPVITSDPGCEGKSCVRMCTYRFTCCLYVFTYYYAYCSMYCMRDPSCFLRYPYGPSGLLLVWTTLLSIRRCTTGTSQVQGRGQSARVVGARVTLELTDASDLYLLLCWTYCIYSYLYRLLY